MKTHNKILLVFLALVLAFITVMVIVLKTGLNVNAIVGNNNVVTIDRNIEASFNKIRVSDRVNVHFVQNDIPSVKLTTDSNLDEYIQTRVVGSELIIDLNARITTIKGIRLDIHGPELKEIHAFRSARFFAEDLRSSQLGIEGSSGSLIKVSGIFDNLRINQSSGSQLELEGETNSFYLQASSGSHVKAASLKAQSGSVNASSGSHVEVNAQELSIQASSGSHVRYIGSPIITNQNLSSGAHVNSMN